MEGEMLPSECAKKPAVRVVGRLVTSTFSLVLCVAEKPSIAKSVASLLSNGNVNSRNTQNKYIKNYCFGQTLNGQNCDVVMTAVLGHLMESDFLPEYKNWRNCDPIELFHAGIITDVHKDKKTLETNLQGEARRAQMLVIWTDCDLEGENIGYEVMKVCRKANPRIAVKRARFSVIQHREIWDAWSRLGELDLRQAAAVDARSELDLRIGSVFTRFQSLTLQPRYPALKDKIISYGPCQFPTLGFIVERYMKNQRFVPETFWKIEVSITREGSTAKCDWARDRLFDQHLCLVLYEMCMDDPMATVVSMTRKPKSKWAPLPLTTVELQKAASRMMRMNSDRVMKVAEDLYNRGIISYPRTETDSFADSFQLHPLIEAQANDPTWGQYAQGLLNGKFVRPRKGKNDDQAHPPIHPVKGAADLQGDEKRVYEFITRRFLACCSAAAQGFETVATIDIAGERFTTKGLSISERNYLDVYVYDKWAEHSIPDFTQGERIMPAELTMTDGQTTAPELLTEADLIGLMEKSGIGTDATIHEHIKKIQDREYANKEGQYFFPTVLGMALISAYEEMTLDLSLHRPYLRSVMESNTKHICAGSRTKADVIQEAVEMYRRAFTRANQQVQVLIRVVGDYLNNGAGDHPQHGPQPQQHHPHHPVGGGGGGPGSDNDDDDDQNDPTFPPPRARRGRTARGAAASGAGGEPRAPSGRGRGARGGSKTSTTSSRGRGRGGRAAMADTDWSNINAAQPTDKPQCDCKLFATLKTSRKQNENEGRQFYSCPKAGAKCRFFAWADEA
ncbi:DNA topoisomerase [Geranomyces michiganensis]|nr:DNA topoisomerase [Geranomyces michiganensis]